MISSTVLKSSFSSSSKTTSSQDAFRNIKNAKILLVDDLIATGGTALASFELIKKAGGECIEA
ncbi:phosphoribosyltransferase family protein, partial [Campylobacter coli]